METGLRMTEDDALEALKDIVDMHGPHRVLEMLQEVYEIKSEEAVTEAEQDIFVRFVVLLEEALSSHLDK